jgi:hypothetical protein
MADKKIDRIEDRLSKSFFGEGNSGKPGIIQSKKLPVVGRNNPNEDEEGEEQKILSRAAEVTGC